MLNCQGKAVLEETRTASGTGAVGQVTRKLQRASHLPHPSVVFHKDKRLVCLRHLNGHGLCLLIPMLRIVAAAPTGKGVCRGDPDPLHAMHGHEGSSVT